MRRWTQSSTKPGNCWQTGVACILGVRPETLPDQVAIERADKSFWNAVNSYLVTHHGLFYSELYDYQFSGLKLRRDWFGGHHLLIGPTIRTLQSGIIHVVVARQGAAVWDPHPSRAGLTEVKRWGVIGRANEAHVAGRVAAREGAHSDVTMRCLCPECGPLPVDPGAQP